MALLWSVGELNPCPDVFRVRLSRRSNPVTPLVVMLSVAVDVVPH